MTTKLPEPQRQPNITVVEPASGVTHPKTWDDWRALFHDAVAVVVSTLIGMNLFTESEVALWIPFVFAIADPLLSAGNVADKARRIIYGVLALLQTSSAAIAMFTSDPQIPMVITAGATIFGALFARFNTPTTTMIPKTRSGPDVNDVLP